MLDLTLFYDVGVDMRSVCFSIMPIFFRWGYVCDDLYGDNSTEKVRTVVCRNLQRKYSSLSLGRTVSNEGKLSCIHNIRNEALK